MSNPDLPSSTPPEDNESSAKLSQQQLAELEHTLEQKVEEEQAEEAELKARWKEEEVKKDAMRMMGKIPLVLIVGYLIFQTYVATSEHTEARFEDRLAFKDSVQMYQEEILERVDIRNSQLDVDPNTLGVSDVFDDSGARVTTGNFEGPQLFIQALEFGDELIDPQRNAGIEDFSVTSLTFDPDHPKLGLPDLNVKISPVTIYEPEEGKLQTILDNIKDALPNRGGDDKPKPYAVYTKDVVFQDGSKQKMAMQLWLTEFKVTIGAKSYADAKQAKEAKKFLRKNKDRSGKVSQELKDSIQVVAGSIAGINTSINDLSGKIKQSEKDLKEPKKKLSKSEEELEKIQEKIEKLQTDTGKPKAKKGFFSSLFGKNPAEKQQELETSRDTLISDIEDQQFLVSGLQETLTGLIESKENWEDSLGVLNRRKAQLEQAGKSYAGFLYGDSQQEKIAVEDLSAETDNQQYEDLKIWLKVMPNSSPWYIKSENAENLKPKMAIGAIYCTEVINDVIEDKPTYTLDKNSPSMNVSQGIAVAMYDEIRPNSPMGQTNEVQELTPLRNSNYYLNERENAGIWDKPYYMKIFLKDIGSHKQNTFINFRGKSFKQYDDQYTFHFVMPLLVRGSWDVIAPQEIIPEWNPPKPRTEERFQFSDLLPSWGIPFLGKGVSLLLLIGGGLFILNFFFPGLRSIIVFLTEMVKDGILGLLKWLKSIFQSKKSGEANS